MSLGALEPWSIGMYLEFDWTFNVDRPRLGDVFTGVNGWRSFGDMTTAKAELALVGLRVGKKTDRRTWKIERAHKAHLDRLARTLIDSVQPAASARALHRYSAEAAPREIDKDKRISRAEARLIHALLRGR